MEVFFEKKNMFRLNLVDTSKYKFSPMAITARTVILVKYILHGKHA